MPPMSLKVWKLPCNATTVSAITAVRRSPDDQRVTKRKEESDRNGAFALLHQLTCDVVDRRDVVGIDGVAQAEAIGEQAPFPAEPGLPEMQSAPRSRRRYSLRSERNRSQPADHEDLCRPP